MQACYPFGLRPSASCQFTPIRELDKITHAFISQNRIRMDLEKPQPFVVAPCVVR